MPVHGKGKKDMEKTLQELIMSHGYPFEQFYYETEDGYINCVHRINGPKGTKTEENNMKN